MRYIGNNKEQTKHLSGITAELRNRKLDSKTYDSIVIELEKKIFKGHDFKLVFTCSKKNKAKKEAQRCRRRGFYTRVREMYPGVYCVYRRYKTIY